MTSPDPAWTRLRARYEAAYAAIVAGDPEPFKAIWAKTGDVTIFGALGGAERGWHEIAPRFDWVSKAVVCEDVWVENVSTIVEGDLAVTVDYEHSMRILDGTRRPRTLRCTQIYRRERGEWWIVHRHADELRGPERPAMVAS